MISLYNEYNETGDYQAFISAKECGNNKDNFLKVLKEELMDDNIELAGEVEEGLVVKDINGNLLVDGDSVTVMKDLKVKGAQSVLKKGTKVKSIRLVDSDHNIDCKIDGFGPMKLKSEFVKKL